MQLWQQPLKPSSHKMHGPLEPSRQRSVYRWHTTAMGGSEAELVALACLENRNFPDEPTTAEVLQRRARERQSLCFAREEAVWSGARMIGYGSLHRAWWVEQPGRYRIYLSVDRDRRRQGIGTRLWERLLSLAAVTERIRWLESGAREDRPRRARLPESKGICDRGPD